MSSPSSTRSASKRKRSNSHSTAAANPKPSIIDLQPSSRDASAEEGDSTTAASSSLKHGNPIPSLDSSNSPPSKRPRNRSTAAAADTANTLASTSPNGTSKTITANSNSTSISKEDPGEPSETTEASADIEERAAKRRTGPSSTTLYRTPSLATTVRTATAASVGTRNKEEQERLKPPERAGLQDPAGYHTNPPPTGRPVRVYADGVFDLFHLGIVRDYEKYITRQLKRGTSRQELNVSWLKKNELEIKRHVAELRDSIKNNWSVTGQELGKELRQFWANSRPSSPARNVSGGSIDSPRTGAISPGNNGNGNGSYFGIGTGAGNRSQLHRLDIPPSRPESPGAGGVGRSEDFATGYSLGLIGGVRAWMTRSRTSLNDTESRHVGTDPEQVSSPSASDEDRDRERTVGVERPLQQKQQAQRGRAKEVEAGAGRKESVDGTTATPMDVEL
ncbi:hypothetical protein PABG_12397 [Paracoccidioides brasiliensis Pb03]|nr:hypothetical protein PABG_12397 [Paracoccidioides brasiliensis Pb03]